MKVGDFELTYCTNIHAGESWPEVEKNLFGPVLDVKRRVSPSRPFGVGLRLSAAAVEALEKGPGAAELGRALRAKGTYVFTINGFPYGPFHGEPVKQSVYRPDWRAPQRAHYTCQLAGVLCDLLPEGGFGSISTVPGGFAPDLQEPSERGEVAAALLEQAVLLWRLHEQRGRTVALALEPEPCCLLETTQEAVAFFQDHLLSREALARVGSQAGLDRVASERLVRRHLGVCLDTCHAAVEFEEPEESLRLLSGAGIAVPKIQLSAGLQLQPRGAALDQLRRYDESVYLHQVVARRADGRLLRYLDLPHAFASPEALAAEEWRVHFHVPIHQRDLGVLSSTQPQLERLLGSLRAHAAAPHLEVETYTWDVLPPARRTSTVAESVARELEWARGGLAP